MEIIDNQLLRKLFNAHAKTSIPFLHLESGTLPIKFIITSRRLNYLHNIITRKNDDLISRIFKAQCESPLEGDFIKLIEKDFQLINEPFDQKRIASMTKKQFKKWVKIKVKKAAFEFLINENETKSKTKKIKYKEFKLQTYLKSNLFSDHEAEYLFKLRSETIPLKANFKTKYNAITKCAINGCSQEENQEHIFSNCETLIKKLPFKNPKVKYQHIYLTLIFFMDRSTDKFMVNFE